LDRSTAIVVGFSMDSSFSVCSDSMTLAH